MGYHTDGQGHVISSRGNCLRLNADTKGYLYFNVKFLSRSKKVGVHRLVAYQKFGDALFVEDIQVRHLDGNHLNNAWNNIAIGTASENRLDMSQHTRLETARNAGRCNSKLTDTDVLRIREMFATGATLRQIMDKYGIAKTTASYIKNRKTYKWL